MENNETVVYLNLGIETSWNSLLILITIASIFSDLIIIFIWYDVTSHCIYVV